MSRKYKFDFVDFQFNPVEAGFLEEAHYWKYSSAKNYAGEVGQVSVEIL